MTCSRYENCELLRKADATMVFCPDSCREIFSGEMFVSVRGAGICPGGEDLTERKPVGEGKGASVSDVVAFEELEEFFSSVEIAEGAGFR